MRPTIHPLNPTRRRHHLAGFTLLEVLAAMCLIVFLVGGVYSIADATLRLSASLSNSRIAEARLTNFTNQWRACLENLPAGTKLTANIGNKSTTEATLLLENCGTPFAWSRKALAAAAVEFRVVREQDQSSLMVRHLKRPERKTSNEEYYTIAELPLLEGITSCSWNFYNAASKRWVNKWNDTAQLPLYLRMRWSLAGDPRQHDAVFWVANDLPIPAASQKMPGAPPSVP